MAINFSRSYWGTLSNRDTDGSFMDTSCSDMRNACARLTKKVMEHDDPGIDASYIICNLKSDAVKDCVTVEGTAHIMVSRDVLSGAK